MPRSQAAAGDEMSAGREQQRGCGVGISPGWEAALQAQPSSQSPTRLREKPLLSLCIVQIILAHHRAAGQVGNLLLRWAWLTSLWSEMTSARELAKLPLSHSTALGAHCHHFPSINPQGLCFCSLPSAGLCTGPEMWLKYGKALKTQRI